MFLHFLKNRINSAPEKINGVSFNETTFIISCASGYFNLVQRENEDLQSFMNRISDYVGAKRLY